MKPNGEVTGRERSRRGIVGPSPDGPIPADHQVRQIDHVGMMVRNVDVAERWYVEVLGAVPFERVGYDVNTTTKMRSPYRHLFVMIGDQRLELVEGPDWRGFTRPDDYAMSLATRSPSRRRRSTGTSTASMRWESPTRARSSTPRCRWRRSTSPILIPTISSSRRGRATTSTVATRTTSGGTTSTSRRSPIVPAISVPTSSPANERAPAGQPRVLPGPRSGNWRRPGRAHRHALRRVRPRPEVAASSCSSASRPPCASLARFGSTSRGRLPPAPTEDEILWAITLALPNAGLNAVAEAFGVARELLDELASAPDPD